jgi:hypothetical protein
MELTVNDIASALKIIDVVATRGAFTGKELSQVGALRDRFAQFVAEYQESIKDKDSANAESTVDNKEVVV